MGKGRRGEHLHAAKGGMNGEKGEHQVRRHGTPRKGDEGIMSHVIAQVGQDIVLGERACGEEGAPW